MVEERIEKLHCDTDQDGSLCGVGQVIYRWRERRIPTDSIAQGIRFEHRVGCSKEKECHETPDARSRMRGVWERYRKGRELNRKTVMEDGVWSAIVVWRMRTPKTAVST